MQPSPLASRSATVLKSSLATRVKILQTVITGGATSPKEQAFSKILLEKLCNVSAMEEAVVATRKPANVL